MPIYKQLIFCTVFFSLGVSFANNPSVNHTTSSEKITEKFNSLGIDQIALAYALKGYNQIVDSLKQDIRYLCIADFAKPSSELRFFVIDMCDTTLFHSDYVSHGKNSGDTMAVSFSNNCNSNQTSLGFYHISEAYKGKHGLSLRLDGLDNGFNDNARKRLVVMHGAVYADTTYINLYGRLGRSQGCPALPRVNFLKIAPYISSKSILFNYYPDPAFIGSSVWLKERVAKD